MVRLCVSRGRLCCTRGRDARTALLNYPPPQLKRDREVVLAAVSNAGEALQYASDELKKDREVVLAAVSNVGRALQYASKELNSDPEVRLTAEKSQQNSYFQRGSKSDFDFGDEL